MKSFCKIILTDNSTRYLKRCKIVDKEDSSIIEDSIVGTVVMCELPENQSSHKQLLIENQFIYNKIDQKQVTEYSTLEEMVADNIETFL